MMIRKLFSSAFAGEALTAKAISADATRDTDEIYEYISAITTVDPIGWCFPIKLTFEDSWKLALAKQKQLKIPDEIFLVKTLE